MLPPRADKLEALGPRPDAQAISALRNPLVQGRRGGLLPALLGAEDVRDLLVQVDIRLRLLLPPPKALVRALQQLHVLYSDLGGLGERQLVALVADGVAEDAFVHEHGFLAAASGGVEGGEEDVHLESRAVQCAPDATQIVADVFAELDGEVLVTMAEARLDETSADVDDCGWRPGWVCIACVPEGG